MEKIIEIKNLSFSYGDNPVFHGLSLSLNAETIYTILGAQGSGKSTLARVLAGLELSSDYQLDEKMKSQTRILFENPTPQFLGKNVLEELTFPLQKLKYNQKEITEKISQITNEFDIRLILFRNPKDLSYGEQQLVMLVETLLENPKLLILDDAFSMLDKITKKKVWEILRKYCKEKNMTILSFTHNSEDVLEGTDVLLLANGTIALQDKVETALQSEKLFTSNQLQLPFIADLSNKLRYYHTVPSVETNQKKLVDIIWK